MIENVVTTRANVCNSSFSESARDVARYFLYCIVQIEPSYSAYSSTYSVVSLCRLKIMCTVGWPKLDLLYKKKLQTKQNTRRVRLVLNLQFTEKMVGRKASEPREQQDSTVEARARSEGFHSTMAQSFIPEKQKKARPQRRVARADRYDSRTIKTQKMRRRGGTNILLSTAKVLPGMHRPVDAKCGLRS